MRYHNITKDDMLNGEGLRVVLWVSGCNHYCPSCQNPVTWDANGGIIFDEKANDELMEALDKDYCSGLTLSGGDPMYPGNREDIFTLCKKVKEKYGNRKTIWMYTGYLFEEIKTEPALDYIDVIIDGPFIEKQKNIKYLWAGSENQRIWEKKNGSWTERNKEWAIDIEPEEKKGGCCGY